MNNALLIVSGGMDSIVMSHYVKQKLKPKKIKLLFFDYGQRALKEELKCVKILSKKIKAPLTVVDLRWLGNISNAILNKKGVKVPKIREGVKKERKDILLWWVPTRNAIFYLVGLAHAESEFLKNKERYDVYLGIKNEGQVAMKDTTPEFLRSLAKIGDEATFHNGYNFMAPLLKFDRTDVIKLGKKLKVDFKETYSCYIESNSNKLIHCGECPNCYVRKKAFYWANIKDLSLYKN
ncbi:MAG: 7-cyano-7-deazaguanine synthase [Candidatus Nanoarchaeia archaeon]|jgi:7-cyano-7-deazaguanine synthase|nr:7-cyano-7-deazaguanine synthase [Candidatus Nanoarchaeia archaeon]|tara:strand:+ start:26680 stop:27387 length:708 start_codon:yes stop_codon:yes gene_type:complete